MKATALTLGTVLVLAAQLAPAASLKVAIAGGGVGGLTAALNMLKAGYEHASEVVLGKTMIAIELGMAGYKYIPQA